MARADTFSQGFGIGSAAVDRMVQRKIQLNEIAEDRQMRSEARELQFEVGERMRRAREPYMRLQAEYQARLGEEGQLDPKVEREYLRRIEAAGMTAWEAEWSLGHEIAATHAGNKYASAIASSIIKGASDRAAAAHRGISESHGDMARLEVESQRSQSEERRTDVLERQAGLEERKWDEGAPERRANTQRMSAEARARDAYARSLDDTDSSLDTNEYVRQFTDLLPAAERQIMQADEATLNSMYEREGLSPDAGPDMLADTITRRRIGRIVQGRRGGAGAGIADPSPPREEPRPGAAARLDVGRIDTTIEALKERRERVKVDPQVDFQEKWKTIDGLTDKIQALEKGRNRVSQQAHREEVTDFDETTDKALLEAEKLLRGYK